MADAKTADKTVDTQEYQGPGRVVNALNYGGSYGFLGGLGGILVPSVNRMAEEKPWVFWASLGIPAVIGLVHGWFSASKGKEQFEAQREQLVEAKTLITEQEKELATTQHELLGERKKFTNMIESRSAEHASHAAALEASKGDSSGLPPL